MDRTDVDPSRPLRHVEERAIGLQVPVPISKRLDVLVERAEAAGIRVYRKDLVAALILAAPDSSEELMELLVRYRRATASDAAVDSHGTADVLSLDRARPGRRPRTS
jgi:hypothetical protein